MRSLVFILLLGAAVAQEDDKIAGGYECDAHSQKWQVSLNTGYHFCSGSLVKRNWVVSAASCYKPQIELRLGEHNIYQTEGNEQFIRSSRVIRHPDYQAWNSDNDIMLIKLMQHATLNSAVQTVTLPTRCTPVGTVCTVSGWGETMTSKDSSTLQCLEIPILPDSDCNCSYPGMITPSKICAGYLEGGKGSCQRDTGGPLVCNNELHGVVSRAESCTEKNNPGVYTKVCVFNAWLTSTMAYN